MLTVLWVLSMAGSIATAALVAGRNASAATRNRVAWQRARWRALGCARRTQNVIDESLRHARTPAEGSHVWRALNDVVDSSPVIAGCHIALEAAGTRLDINSASPEMLERLFVATRQFEDPRQLAADIVAGRVSVPFAELRAVERVRPLADWSGCDSLLSVEPGRIVLSSAPSIVLQAIPGFTAEIADAVVAHRSSDGPPAELTDIFGLVSRESGAELEERFQDAARVATADPDAWLLRSAARSGVPAISVVVEWRLVRQTDRVVIVRSTVR
jgi:hypothetical protein